MGASLTPPPKVQRLRTTLHAKAKGWPEYRPDRLDDEVYRRDILEFAYLRRRSHGGAPGVDGRTFEGIGAYGRDRWLDGWATELGGERIGRTPCVARSSREGMARGARWASEISDQTSARWPGTDVEGRVARLDRILRGRSNDFGLGPVSAVYRALDRPAGHRLRRKHRRTGQGT